MHLDLDKSAKYGLAYSGGVDSCCLLAWMLHEGYDVKAYTIVSDFQLKRDIEDASRIARMLGAEHEIIRVNV